jgi:hypothetical protein
VSCEKQKKLFGGISYGCRSHDEKERKFTHSRTTKPHPKVLPIFHRKKGLLKKNTKAWRSVWLLVGGGGQSHNQKLGKTHFYNRLVFGIDMLPCSINFGSAP